MGGGSSHNRRRAYISRLVETLIGGFCLRQNLNNGVIIAFLESRDFEDAIRNAISLGGDSDTLAAITGSIAEAAYGIPDWIKDKAYSYLDEPLKDVLRRWRKYIKAVNGDRRAFHATFISMNEYLLNNPQA